MTFSLSRYNPIPPIRRLFGTAPTVTGTITDETAVCPQAADGTAPLERCMNCDRLVVLQVDADGNGSVTCRTDA
jgi:hypothetical protein